MRAGKGYTAGWVLCYGFQAPNLPDGGVGTRRSVHKFGWCVRFATRTRRNNRLQC